MPVRICFVFGLGCLAACTGQPGGTSSSSGSTDAGVVLLPAEPVDAVPGPAAAIVADRNVGMALTAALPLESGAWVAASETGVVILREGAEPQALGAAVGDLTAAAEIAEGVLVAGSEGIFVVTAAGTLRSPLSDEVGDHEVRAIHADGRRVWIVASDGIRLLDSSTIRAVALNGVDLAGAPTAFGARWQGSPALWTVAGGKALALRAVPGGVEAWRVRDDLVVQDVAVDGDGAVLLRDEDGDFHVRQPDGTWSWYHAPAAFTGMRGAGVADEVWLDTASGPWVYAEGAFRPVQDMPAGSVLGVGPRGRLLVKGSDSAAVYRARRNLALGGLPAGGILTEAVDVILQPEDATLLRRARLWIDDGPETELLLPDPHFVLNPNTLGLGSHRVRVAAYFAQNALSASVEVTIRVEVVRIPTWTADVGPLNQEKCTRCHGSRGNAHRMDTREAWITEIDDILGAVRDGRMPLNTTPLSAGEIGLIEAWQAAGFPE